MISDDIGSSRDLSKRIEELKAHQKESRLNLKNEFDFAIDSIRPINLIKSTFEEAAESPDLIKNALVTSAGVGIGILVKRMVSGSMKNPGNKILVAGFTFVVTALVSRYSDKIIEWGRNVADALEAYGEDESTDSEVTQSEVQSF
jgi:hypothetical protein